MTRPRPPWALRRRSRSRTGSIQHGRQDRVGDGGRAGLTLAAQPGMKQLARRRDHASSRAVVLARVTASPTVRATSAPPSTAVKEATVGRLKRPVLQLRHRYGDKALRNVSLCPWKIDKTV